MSESLLKSVTDSGPEFLILILILILFLFLILILILILILSPDVSSARRELYEPIMIMIMIMIMKGDQQNGGRLLYYLFTTVASGRATDMNVHRT
jgi:hypothetical protein